MALVDSVDLTQKGARRRIAPPRRMGAGEVMEIDAQTRRNLELTESVGGRPLLASAHWQTAR